MKLFRIVPLVALMATMACDEECLECPPPPPPQRVDRSEKWHVINNIELAYNQRKISYYDALLDENFTFFLSTGDVGGGLPESWGREVDVQANTNLFSKEAVGDLPRVKNIRMNIQWEKDPAARNRQPDPQLLSWTALVNSGPNQDETWYTATLLYDFDITVDIPNTEEDLTYQTSYGSKAEFIVRNAGTVDAPKWTLVEMRDLGATRALASATARTKSTTWGQVKALYRG